MIKKSRYLVFNIFLCSFLILFQHCHIAPEEENQIYKKTVIDLDAIKEKGKLIVVTNKNSTNYFVLKGVPMGYHFDLISSFASSIDVDLEIIPTNDLAYTFDLLKSGGCDVVASGLNITKSRRQYFDFTVPVLTSRQVLIQKKPDGWEKMSQKELDKKMVRNITDLKGKTIYILNKSSFYETLQEISIQLDGNLNIIEISEHGIEQLISLVSKGSIDYTVCDEHVALVNKAYYPNIDISMPLSIPQNLSWAVRKESTQLLNTLNQWLLNYKKTEIYKLLYVKYFQNPNADKIFRSEYSSLNEGRISAYDEIMKTHCAKAGMDWRLLAALIFQESRFLMDTTSKKGAFGMMQMIPETAKKYGVTDSSSASHQIAAGVKYINWIYKKLPAEITDRDERAKFMLASYNVGIGHVLDAYKLTKKYGSNPHLWDNHVEKYLLEKSKPEFYTDSVVKNGICRGLETYRFVKNVWNRYQHYKNLIKH